MRSPKVELYRSGSLGSPRWYWHKKAANGRIVSDSGPFWTKSGAKRNAKRENPGVDIIDTTVLGS
jgi:hypothetical protein